MEKIRPISHQEIRKTFLEYFESVGHHRIKSASLIPQNDPTLLVINSGMAPLKKYFTGEKKPISKRLTNVQKCVRTNDIENVGDNRHLTFFEMMGNWSLGDYFKKDALYYSWDLLTNKFKFPKDKLHVTVYGGDPVYKDIPTDEEAYKIWSSLGIPDKRIHPLGAEHNFWGPAGTSGPCGPCSEVFFDMGKDKGCKLPECGPDCDCGRFVEIWNPGVFMQYNKDERGKVSKLVFNSVDAGAGLERFALVLQGVETVFETDLLKPISDALISENKILDIKTNDRRVSLRVMTDHLKSAVFMMSDGIYPSNTKREYVVRRLIRRMVTSAQLLGISELKVNDAVSATVACFKDIYPELAQSQSRIIEGFRIESNGFAKTLNKAEKTLDRILQRSHGQVSGEDAFMLQNTFGLPYEILNNILRVKGFTINREEFDVKMQAHRNISRNKNF